MFEQIFDQYRKAVESSFEMQQEMYREWMNGLPVKPPDVGSSASQRRSKEQIQSYQEAVEPDPGGDAGTAPQGAQRAVPAGHRGDLSAFRTTEAKTPEEFWRLTQEFWRKSIDSYKTAFQTQTKYVQNLASMWLELFREERF